MPQDSFADQLSGKPHWWNSEILNTFFLTNPCVTACFGGELLLSELCLDDVTKGSSCGLQWSKWEVEPLNWLFRILPFISLYTLPGAAPHLGSIPPSAQQVSCSKRTGGMFIFFAARATSFLFFVLFFEQSLLISDGLCSFAVFCWGRPSFFLSQLSTGFGTQTDTFERIIIGAHLYLPFSYTTIKQPW